MVKINRFLFGPGGRHARFGTHNRLLGLGPDLYLEVIAPDPDAAPFEGPRWFGLDTPPPVPRLANWIVAVADMDDFDPTVTNSPKFRLIAVQCVSAPSAPPHVHVERAPRVGRQKEAPRDRRVVTPASHHPRSLDVPIDAPARLMHVLIHR